MSELQSPLSQLKVALVHNWLTTRGGSENVLFELAKMYPDAPIYTLVYDAKKFPELSGRKIITSWLQYIPVLRWHHELFPPLRYLIWRFTYLKNFDLVITNCSSENKAVRVLSGKHIAYIHTPPHYYWRYFEEYLKDPGFGKLDFLARGFLKLLNPVLRYFDKKAAQNPDVILGNSNFICAQIKDYYGRDAQTLYPPVNLLRFSQETETTNYQPPTTNYFLCFGRQTVFKKMNLVVEAFSNLDLNLVVAGRGSENSNLKKLAKDYKNIYFADSPSDEQLEILVQNAKACVFANEEDFGITWVESMAAGIPVICYGSGGALETVASKVSGLLFDTQSAESIKDALTSFEQIKWDKAKIKLSVSPYSEQNFYKNLGTIIKRINAAD